MSKKTFKAEIGLDALLGGLQPEPKKRGRPRTSTRKPEKTSEEGTLEGETRATFIVSKEYLEGIKDIAYWERTTIKDVLAEALKEYLEGYRERNGEVEPRPKK